MNRTFKILLFSTLLMLAVNFGYAQKGGGHNSGSSIGCNIFVPNAFTPNGDEINDRFTIKHSDVCDIQEFNLKIFDRWGRLVYESKSADPNLAWDGTLDNKELQQGVYMWNLFVRIRPTTIGDPEVIKQHGTVVIIR